MAVGRQAVMGAHEVAGTSELGDFVVGTFLNRGSLGASQR